MAESTSESPAAGRPTLSPARTIARALGFAALGLIVAVAALVGAGMATPGVTIAMDAALPGVLTGVYGPERDGDTTFAWTSRTATMHLPGLDRRGAATCAIRLRGPRPPGLPFPTVTVAVDGIATTTARLGNAYTTIEVPVARRPDAGGLVLTMATTPIFVPGPGDRRELGSQVDDITCGPAAGVTALPPRPALVAVAVAGAAFGFACAILGTAWWSIVALLAIIAAAQAAALGTGAAAYTGYADLLPTLAAWIVAAQVACGLALVGRRAGLSAEARLVIALAGVSLYVILVGLLHPAKAIADAAFHAHRLEWVHQGRYFFTQVMPSGVTFPYAIGLYVVSLPFMVFTADHIRLLRIVVAVAHVLTGIAIYALVTRSWQDRRAGAAAATLWVLVPQWYVVVGYANMTNAFAQSVATTTLAAAFVAGETARGWRAIAVFFALASLAFLSHVSTLPLLAATLLAVAACWWWLGDRALRAGARVVVVVTLAAAAFSIVSYYAWFPEVYAAVHRVWAAPAASAAPQVPAAPPAATVPAGLSSPFRVDIGESTRRGGPTPPVPVRAFTAIAVGVTAVGWPLLALSVVGGWTIAARRRDALTLALLAWLATGAIVVALAVVTHVEPQFYRYTVEFIGRVYYATWPALVVLAGAGFAAASRRSAPWRVVAVALLAAAAATGAGAWLAWFK